MQNQKSLLETFDNLRNALISCDVDTLKELIADDYCGFDPQGNPQDLSMTLEAYQPGGVKLDRYDVEDMKTHVIDNVGILTGKGQISGTFSGSEFEDHLRFLDIYVFRSGQWQLFLSQTTPLVAV